MAYSIAPRYRLSAVGIHGITHTGEAVVPHCTRQCRGGGTVTLERGESVRALDAGRKLRVGENHEMNIFRGDFAIGLRASQAKRELRMHSKEAHAKRRCRSGLLNALKRVTAHLGVPRETCTISVPG